MGIVALVLAAGKSSRMGSDKLSMRLRADTTCKTYKIHKASDATVGGQVLSVLVQAAVFSSLIIVQSPESASAWHQECSDWQQRYPELIHNVLCTDATQGMSHSIRCGVEYARNTSAEALMIVLADQPLIEAPYIEQLAMYWLQHQELDYVAAAGAEGAVPPIIFSIRVWDRLEQLTGDQGARRLLSNSELQGATIPLPEHCFWDADTLEALEQIRLFLAKEEDRE